MSGVEGYGLRVVGDARELVKKIIKICDSHPEHRYTLNQQIFRASISVGSNIVEGSRRTKKEFSRFIDIAVGSCDEVKFQISLYGEKYEEVDALCDKIIGQLINLKRSLN